jgi:hypothetical protein
LRPLFRELRFGIEVKDKPNVILVVFDSNLYQYELVEKGGYVSGNYDRLTSEGKKLSGTAAGEWRK